VHFAVRQSNNSLVAGLPHEAYARSQKVLGSRPDEVNELFSMYLILLATLGPEVHSASNRNEYQKQTNNVFGQ
jgi:hypothetical protein